MTVSSYILLNAGSATRDAFRAGIPNLPFMAYRTKQILLHIQADGVPVWRSGEHAIDFTEASVFLRLRASDTHFCGMLYEFLNHHHIPANDPIHLSYPYSGEKITQMLLLALHGIRIPESFIFREESFVHNRTYLKTHISFPAVYKLDGSKGRNVRVIHSFEELEACVAQKPKHLLALVQPFIENTFDTRTLVAYGEILGSISRTRREGHLNNIAQGAIPALFTLTDDEKAVALRAAEACRIDFAGIDLIHTEGGPIVLEVNKSPQVGGFESVHPFKVFTKIAEIIRRRTS